MRSFSFLAAVVYAAGFADAFQQATPITTQVATSRSATALYVYIPSGF
eukprot:CAMPEP_0201883604 /NCGR_PEP_ID=MMETSP0902-20130614/16094_1 /ASSEMBLY_ACC=CAM_ASM_000551 /TAXON_ID=420261 /ORGANISM="Thalassiosira antarctica, Strain CCMP982" /LENGTH=47 /DNA_ID= /DNA_START= /DNA_END= /DNA_ORIENTATION=